MKWCIIWYREQNYQKHRPFSRISRWVSMKEWNNQTWIVLSLSMNPPNLLISPNEEIERGFSRRSLSVIDNKTDPSIWNWQIRPRKNSSDCFIPNSEWNDNLPFFSPNHFQFYRWKKGQSVTVLQLTSPLKGEEGEGIYSLTSCFTNSLAYLSNPLWRSHEETWEEKGIRDNHLSLLIATHLSSN